MVQEHMPNTTDPTNQLITEHNDIVRKLSENPNAPDRAALERRLAELNLQIQGSAASQGTKITRL